MSHTAQAGASAEMIFSGDELFRGDTLNTNQSYLGGAAVGLRHLATHALSVADDLEAMVEPSGAAWLVIRWFSYCQEDWGPTEDDLTREAVAEALNVPWSTRTTCSR